jgi:hypothetical protein
VLNNLTHWAPMNILILVYYILFRTSLIFGSHLAEQTHFRMISLTFVHQRGTAKVPYFSQSLPLLSNTLFNFTFNNPIRIVFCMYIVMLLNAVMTRTVITIELCIVLQCTVITIELSVPASVF